MKRVAVYFVASPLQYLAALQVARHHEAGARQVLVWYKKGMAGIVRADEWDACSYMSWPRWEPLPGAFGRHRRLRANIALVADLVGPCDDLHLHSAVFDTEAINYFLHALPRRTGARQMQARILPDGVISIRRYPLSRAKRMAQYLRRLRQLVAPELKYSPFGGDRIGSDAPFCDRIYTLPGLPHEYPPDKVVVLPPLVEGHSERAEGGSRRALVIGQPLHGAGLMTSPHRDEVSREMHAWLASQNFDQIEYKGHPKDPRQELCEPDYQALTIDEPLERWMSHEHYDAVVGVRSSALIFARQLYGPHVPVLAFGWHHVRFKSDTERADMRRAFESAGVAIRGE